MSLESYIYEKFEVGSVTHRGELRILCPFCSDRQWEKAGDLLGPS